MYNDRYLSRLQSVGPDLVTLVIFSHDLEDKAAIDQTNIDFEAAIDSADSR